MSSPELIHESVATTPEWSSEPHIDDILGAGYQVDSYYLMDLDVRALLDVAKPVLIVIDNWGSSTAESAAQILYLPRRAKSVLMTSRTRETTEDVPLRADTKSYVFVSSPSRSLFFESDETSPPDRLVEELRRIFNDATGTAFEDGMASEFSRNLLTFVDSHGLAALDALERLAFLVDTPPDVSGEALRWVADIDDSPTHDRRRSLLELSLRHRSYLVRDGAICGLGCLEDPKCLHALKSAMRVEREAILYEDMRQLCEQLEAMT